MTQEDLYKNRSYAGCIKAGYKTLADNLKKIVRRTWKLAFAPAITGGALLTASICYPENSLLNFVIIILYLAAYIVWDGKVYSLLNGQPLRWNSTRTLKAKLASVVPIIILSVLLGIVLGVVLFSMNAGAKEPDTAMMPEILIGVFAFTVIVCLFCLPLMIFCMKYQFEPKQRLWSAFKSGYKNGMRHFGFLLAVTIVVGIITFIIELILFSPYNIVLTASAISRIGTAMGDPTGLPDNFALLTFVSGCVTMYFMSYLLIWTEFTLYYTYGTIETRENERLKAKNLIYRP